MKLAIFKNMEFGYETAAGPLMEGDGYVRISEYVDVEFPPLADGDIVKAQIDELDAVAEKITRKYRESIAQIDECKSKLLVITHQPESTQ